jgi:hypothetical protein
LRFVTPVTKREMDAGAAGSAGRSGDHARARYSAQRLCSTGRIRWLGWVAQRLGDAPRLQFVDAVSRMVGDAAQHVAQMAMTGV